MLVCDVCGKPASETVGIRAGGRSLQKDFCELHLAELTAGARQARRGRPRGSSSKPAAAKASRKKATTRRRTTSRKRAGRRKGSSRKSAATRSAS